MPYNFAADSFHTKKNFVADFLQAILTAVLRFQTPFWRLRVNVR